MRCFLDSRLGWSCRNRRRRTALVGNRRRIVLLVLAHECRQLLLADHARHKHHDLAIGRVKIRRRVVVNGPDLHRRVARLTTVAAKHVGETEVVALNGAMRGVLIDAIVHDDPNDDEVIASVHVIQIGELHFAARTPWRPEIHQHPLSCIVGKLVSLALGVGEIEIHRLRGMSLRRKGCRYGKTDNAEPLFQCLSFRP